MIYLVEDNDVLLNSLITLLKEVVHLDVAGSASTEDQATAWLQEQGAGWSLAVIDLFLLQGSGLGVLSSCHDRQPWQKVVILTNYATPDIRRRALALGADAVFDKAQEFNEFLDYCGQFKAEPITPGV